MSSPSTPRRLWDQVMGLGSYPGEAEAQAGKRRIVIGYIILGFLPRIIFGTESLSAGLTAVAMMDYAAAVLPLVALAVLARWPHTYVWVVNFLLAMILIENTIPTIMLGGIVESGLLMAWGILAVIGALIALSRRAALIWFAIYIVSLFATVTLTETIDPIYDVDWSSIDIAAALTGVTVFLFLAMSYFVRQRDRLQQESDDLLHNILPDDVAARLKSSPGLIADHYAGVSVLFADVVDFTPMSADMEPTDLVALLNSIFSTFDGFVDELGVEKIKTVGDEYMVAAGVPRQRDDHATAVSELALRIRDHVASHEFEGHQISLRIGINSGPVVAGIVGTHKFAYDLWGDVVNVASRMESEGVPGEIQISESTYGLIRDDFDCAPRGTIPVKGRGDMSTYLLISSEK
ncbi:MAG: adenylate/guanylate cyclase domain-containing protein [Acidimicrobiia bacterium]